MPSVYFFSLDAQGLASVTGARLFHHLPYYYARIALETSDGPIQFESQRRHPGARPGRYEATYWPTGEPFDAPTDPLAEFLVEREQLSTKSDAAIRVAELLGWPYRAARVGRVIPSRLRDSLYDFVANHRYDWFGRKDQCMRPEEDVSDRFL